ncbi:hypothetical protein WG66_016260 [Moniliophthora roreri]|nr:hypothetical protein WG66_016260 [Moniliophthora roreri]
MASNVGNTPSDPHETGRYNQVTPRFSAEDVLTTDEGKQGSCRNQDLPEMAAGQVTVVLCPDEPVTMVLEREIRGDE